MDTNKKPFNLLPWYTSLSFVCIVLVSVVAGLLLSQFLTETLLQRDALVTKEFVQSLFEKENAVVLFTKEYSGDREATFKALVHRLSTMPEVERVNIYGTDGTVLWSDDERLIRHNFMPNPELIIALSGKLAISSGMEDKPQKGEHVFDAKVPFFAEIYIPIWDRSIGKIIGVFEVYKTPMRLFQVIKKGQRLVWIGAALGGLFIFTSLYWIVKRAAAVIEQQQEQLVESETMVVVGVMSSALAHAIRNPLASIRSSAELAMEGGPANLCQETSKDIISEVDRLSGWVSELLAFAHISFGASTPIQLNEVIRSIFTSFEIKMKEQQIEGKLDLEESLPKINADEVPLRHVLISLITNAMEAMSDGGAVIAKTCFLADEGLIELSISDTGKGVPKDQIKKVFKPFFTTKRTGVGVGLALVKRIINRYNGSIKMESTEGHGARVRIRIPVPK